MVVKHPRPETTVEIEEENNFTNSSLKYPFILLKQILATHPPNSKNRLVKKKVYHHWQEDNLVSYEFLTKKKQPERIFILFCK